MKTRKTGFSCIRLFSAVLIAVFFLFIMPALLLTGPGQVLTDNGQNRSDIFPTRLSENMSAICAYASGEEAEMRTLAFASEVEVRENNSFYVTEKISVEFLNPASGFTRGIMLRGSARMLVDGEYVYRDVVIRVSKINVEGGPYKTYKEDNDLLGKQFITIGDPKKPLEGRRDFVITYTLNFDISPGGSAGGSDVLPENDFVYIDLIPLSWPTDIDSVSVKITFPKDADISDADLIIRQPDGGETGIFEDRESMDVQFLWPDAEGKYTITAQSLRPVKKNEALTFQVTLPIGYFETERYFYPAEIAFFIIAIAAPVLCFFFWFRFGRNRSIVETVEFRPPEGLTPAETGLFWNGKLFDRDLYSMFLYWAGKGLIDIKETPGQDFVLYRKSEGLPKGSKPFENNMFSRIFGGEDYISLKESALNIGKAMHGARDDILKEYRKEQNLLYEKRSLNMRAFSFLIAFLPVLFNTVYAGSTAYWRFEASDFISIIFLMCFLIFLSLSKGGGIPSSKKTKTAQFFDALKSPLFIVSMFMIIISAFVIVTSGFLTLETPLHSILAAVSTVLCMVFAMMTRKMTEYCVRMLGQIRGFANFIRTAETGRIKMLADEDPDYFFDVLPYAWAMELTDEWDDRFNRFGLTIMPPNVVISSPQSIVDIENAAAGRNVSATSTSLVDKDGPEEKAARTLKSFTVRRSRTDIAMSVAIFLVLAGLFVWEIFRFRQALTEGSPFPDLSYFQSANTEFWADRIAGFILFLVLSLVGLYFMIANVSWQVRVNETLVQIQKTPGKKLQIDISEISGVDIRADKYVLMRGTKALTKVKPTDKGFNLLMERLGL